MVKGKRKAGHIGFQSSEVAFIEDEMAALAKEYGLELDEEVVLSVSKRKEAKRARKTRPKPTPDATSTLSAATTTMTATSKRKTIKAQLTEISELHVCNKLRDIMPQNCVLAKCVVPGCACTRGDRHVVIEQGFECEETALELLNHVTCKGCNHRILQHQIARDEKSDTSKDVGGFRGLQRMLSDLFQLIRFARLGGCFFESLAAVSSSLELIKQRIEAMRRRQQGNSVANASNAPQNGPQNAAESLHERQIIHELSALVSKAENAMKSCTRDELPIHFACCLDAMYFHCYYAMLVLYGRNCAIMASPADYFASIEPTNAEENDKIASFLETEQLDADDLVGATGTLRDSNELHRLQALRFREGVRLFYEKNIGMGGEVEDTLIGSGSSGVGGATASSVSSKKKKKSKKQRSSDRSSDEPSNQLEEMPCFPLLAQWRNNCRDWACHLFAYATPTNSALQEMAQYAPLVEIGAGTGYWSSLLLEKRVDIVAYDKFPLCCDEAAEDTGHQGAANAYHGQVPAYCKVEKAGPEKLSDVDKDRNLFLCYPPPHDEMARKCLRYFKGTYVLHVGEWQGDTGDRRFETLLVSQFELVRRIELPNWGNTAYALTIWRRRALEPSKQMAAESPLVQCHVCGNSDVTRLRRCVLCKTKIYCSERCARADQISHSKEHARRLVFVDSRWVVAVDDDRFYRSLRSLEVELDHRSDQPSLVNPRSLFPSKQSQQDSNTQKNDGKAASSSGSGAFTFNFVP